MINKNKRVYVYFNLHKKVWSVRQSGKVVKHTKNIILKDCRFLVGKAGRERVIREGRKNVHAGISGYVVDDIPDIVQSSCGHLTYNPYKYKGFVSIEDPHEVVTHSDYAHMECEDGYTSVWATWNC